MLHSPEKKDASDRQAYVSSAVWFLHCQWWHWWPKLHASIGTIQAWTSKTQLSRPKDSRSKAPKRFSRGGQCCRDCCRGWRRCRGALKERRGLRFNARQSKTRWSHGRPNRCNVFLEVCSDKCEIWSGKRKGKRGIQQKLISIYDIYDNGSQQSNEHGTGVMVGMNRKWKASEYHRLYEKTKSDSLFGYQCPNLYTVAPKLHSSCTMLDASLCNLKICSS